MQKIVLQTGNPILIQNRAYFVKFNALRSLKILGQTMIDCLKNKFSQKYNLFVY